MAGSNTIITYEKKAFDANDKGDLVVEASSLGWPPGTWLWEFKVWNPEAGTITLFQLTRRSEHLWAYTDESGRFEATVFND